jgi:hypothetical protein
MFFECECGAALAKPKVRPQCLECEYDEHNQYLAQVVAEQQARIRELRGGAP